MPEAKLIPAKYIFLDIDDFTLNRSGEAQSDIIRALNSIVKNVVKEYKIEDEKVLFLPRGDGLGVALLDVDSPFDIHLLIALRIIREVSRFSRSRSDDEMRRFKVRVGIDANTDNLITDINGSRNIAGAGVNIAASVMNLADGNQILVSDPVFENLQRHEKYLSSFKNFRAKIKHGLELPVHQFVAADHEGLNTSVPEALQTAADFESRPAKTIIAEKVSRVGKVEFNEPAKTASSIPEISLPETQRTQTHSYLTGILAEQTKTETKGGWIKPQTEPKPFLEEVVPPKKSNPILWSALALFLLGGAGFAAWMFSGNAPVEPVNSAATETVSEKPAAVTPAGSPATSVQTPAQNQTVAENTPKTEQAFTQKTAEVTENEPAPRSRQRAPRQVENRPVIQPKIIQPRVVKTAAPVKPKPQTAKAEKPRDSKKVTLDDLINGNR